jgi:hypothetical protein
MENKNVIIKCEPCAYICHALEKESKMTRKKRVQMSSKICWCWSLKRFFCKQKLNRVQMSRSVKEFLRDENVSHQILSHSQNVATWNNFEKSKPNIV